jgi:hypothetical protein
MTTLTIWINAANQVQVVQLSDDPEDGLAAEQIEYLSTLPAYIGLTCTSQDYLGTFPNTDAALWKWEGGSIVSAPVPSPAVVSMRQARLALLQSGFLEQVSSAIAAGSQVDLITWEYATEVRREDPLVANLSAALGLTSQQLDNLFTLAATL